MLINPAIEDDEDRGREDICISSPASSTPLHWITVIPEPFRNRVIPPCGRGFMSLFRPDLYFPESVDFPIQLLVYPSVWLKDYIAATLVATLALGIQLVLGGYILRQYALQSKKGVSGSAPRARERATWHPWCYISMALIVLYTASVILCWVAFGQRYASVARLSEFNKTREDVARWFRENPDHEGVKTICIPAGAGPGRARLLQAVQAQLRIILRVQGGVEICIPGKFGHSSWLAIVLPVLVNVVVTVAIITRIVSIRRQTRKLVRRMPSDNVYLGLTALLVESSLPSALFGILAIILHRAADAPAEEKIKFLPTMLWIACTSLSPQLIVIRVLQGRAWNKQVVKSAWSSMDVPLVTFESQNQGAQTSNSISRGILAVAGRGRQVL
ncbi:hypothetical protein NMY22_g19370 [Coprinellus aureogranulatus]|nr:hypothetical protein NMY22_g19370 [Coprinellus aureogranulatus]